MSVFTKYLKKQNELIRVGLGLLDAYHKDLEQGKCVAIEDMRIAVYAMQSAFENSHLAEMESILYPAMTNSEEWKNLPVKTQQNLESNMLECEKGRKSLLELRLSIEDYERNPRQLGMVGWRLSDFIEYITLHLDNEERELFLVADQILNASDQKNLYQRSKKSAHEQNSDHLHGPRLIFSRLRIARGMTAA